MNLFDPINALLCEFGLPHVTHKDTFKIQTLTSRMVAFDISYSDGGRQYLIAKVPDAASSWDYLEPFNVLTLGLKQRVALMRAMYEYGTNVADIAQAFKLSDTKVLQLMAA